MYFSLVISFSVCQLVLSQEYRHPTCYSPLSIPADDPNINRRTLLLHERASGWLPRSYSVPDTYYNATQFVAAINMSPVPAFNPIYNIPYIACSGVLGSAYSAAEAAIKNSRTNLIQLYYNTHILPTMNSLQSLLTAPTLQTFGQIYSQLEEIGQPASYPFYDSDINFAATRLTTQVYTLTQVKCITDIHFNTNEINGLLNITSGQTIETLINKKHLFIEDFTQYNITRDLASPGAEVEAPIVLYFINDDNYLTPLAIHFTLNNHNTYSPMDSHADWFAAKAMTNAVGLSITTFAHLLETHLMLGNFRLAAEQTLADAHPVYKLISQATKIALGINSLGVQTSLMDGGAFDKVITFSAKSLREHFGPMLSNNYDFSQAYLDVNYENRGLTDIPNNYFYEDGSTLFSALYEYTAGILSSFYTTHDLLMNDPELNRFLDALSSSTSPSYINGFPSEVHSVQELSRAVTQVMWLAGVKHHTINSESLLNYQVVYPHAPPRIVPGCFPLSKNTLQESDLVNKCILGYGPKNFNVFTTAYVYALKSKMLNVQPSDTLSGGYGFPDKNCNLDEMNRLHMKLEELTVKMDMRNEDIRQKGVQPPYISLYPYYLPFTSAV